MSRLAAGRQPAGAGVTGGTAHTQPRRAGDRTGALVPRGVPGQWGSREEEVRGEESRQTSGYTLGRIRIHGRRHLPARSSPEEAQGHTIHWQQQTRDHGNGRP
ncbi:hypothetical protein AcV5_001990 [Taiwanofungus camphoratus]|nr:hypothetical protein AcV5_001990 [Antrodia cinnamomea]